MVGMYTTLPSTNQLFSHLWLSNIRQPHGPLDATDCEPRRTVPAICPA